VQDSDSSNKVKGKHQIDLASVHREVARRRAAGIAIPYVLAGKLVEEHPDGRIKILAQSVGDPEQNVDRNPPAAQ